MSHFVIKKSFTYAFFEIFLEYVDGVVVIVGFLDAGVADMLLRTCNGATFLGTFWISFSLIIFIGVPIASTVGFGLGATFKVVP